MNNSEIPCTHHTPILYTSRYILRVSCRTKRRGWPAAENLPRELRLLNYSVTT